jgi:heptosyltransferase-2
MIATGTMHAETAVKDVINTGVSPGQENIHCKPWNGPGSPRSVLFIRLHAMGDVAITLPYIHDFCSKNPACKVDLLTLKASEGIPFSLNLFNKVFSIRGGRNSKLQALFSLLLLPLLLMRSYDVVIDLQNNRKSRIIRKLLSPAAWSEFDRTSPRLAGERTKSTIEAAVPGEIKLKSNFSFKNAAAGKNILHKHGWNGEKIIVLNPAGLHGTRNWALENYAALAKLFLEQDKNDHLFLMLGLDNMKEKAGLIKKELGDKLIDLSGKTSAAMAFSILQHASLVVSEDSGLMHMAWVSGIPTLAIFGSSRSDWSAPASENSICLNSSDLECGCCMSDICRWGDNRCLSRYSAGFVFEKAQLLMSIGK